MLRGKNRSSLGNLMIDAQRHRRTFSFATPKFIFAGCDTGLNWGRAAPMWRNGRRNGLKIAVLAISLLFAAHQIGRTLLG
jgi:hypothetical protein